MVEESDPEAVEVFRRAFRISEDPGRFANEVNLTTGVITMTTLLPRITKHIGDCNEITPYWMAWS